MAFASLILPLLPVDGQTFGHSTTARHGRFRLDVAARGRRNTPDAGASPLSKGFAQLGRLSTDRDTNRASCTPFRNYQVRIASPAEASCRWTVRLLHCFDPGCRPDGCGRKRSFSVVRFLCRSAKAYLQSITAGIHRAFAGEHLFLRCSSLLPRRDWRVCGTYL